MARTLAAHRSLGALAIWLALFAVPSFVLSVQAQSAEQNLSGQYDLGQEFQVGTPQSSILTIQPDRMFSESAFGRRVTQEVEAEGAVLTAENRRIEAELRAEEQGLTERRSTTEPNAFRTLADAFDAKVQETRRQQDQKLRDINALRENARREFLNASLPMLEQIMLETGAGAILDHSTVFLSSDAVDITELAIARIDRVLGDGLDQSSFEPSDQSDDQ